MGLSRAVSIPLVVGGSWLLVLGGPVPWLGLAFIGGIYAIRSMRAA